MDGFEIGDGRTRLRIHWRKGVEALYVHIGGGQDHIGAMVLVGRDVDGEVFERAAVIPPHKEGDMVLSAARRLHAELGGLVCVTGGVHLEDITREEIGAVLSNAEEGVARLVSRLRTAQA